MHADSVFDPDTLYDATSIPDWILPLVRCRLDAQCELVIGGRCTLAT